MPMINLHIADQPDEKLSQKLAHFVSASTARHLRKDPKVTAISISYIDKTHWFAGGDRLSDSGKTAFWLDIKIVDGTNTKQELAAYITAIYAGMEELLGPLHHESYVLVDEVPAAAYGFGGLTQEYRFITGLLKAQND